MEPEPLTTIRKALMFSYRLGAYSGFDWFAALQKDALKALNRLEVKPESVCTWTPEMGSHEECDT